MCGRAVGVCVVGMRKVGVISLPSSLIPYHNNWQLLLQQRIRSTPNLQQLLQQLLLQQRIRGSTPNLQQLLQQLTTITTQYTYLIMHPK